MPLWLTILAHTLQEYQDLCQIHKTFRERSENVDVSVEVSLQPWRAFKPDGVILFSDILTPLTGMNIPFDIVAGKGPIIENPIRTMDQVRSSSLACATCCLYGRAFHGGQLHTLLLSDVCALLLVRQSFLWWTAAQCEPHWCRQLSAAR